MKAKHINELNNFGIKIANVPIGMVSQAPLGNLKEGDFVRIKYNPQKPKKSYMPDNDGMLLT